MKEIRTEIIIDSSPERVWSVLTEFESFPEWNPFIVRALGTIDEGEIIEVHLQPPGGKGMTFKPRLIRVETNKELRWLGRLLMPGVFDGEHVFQLTRTDDGRTRFVHREEFRGVLVRPLLAMVGKKTASGFQRMNQALKARVESPTQS